MKIHTKAKRFYKKNKMLSIGLAAAGAYYVMTQRGMAPTLAPAPRKAATAMAPTARSGYDTYAPIRNEPYTNSTHFFGPADGDPVFYGF
jgi:hypothetical protein